MRYSQKIMPRIKSSLIYISILAISLITFDILSYFFSPQDLVSSFSYYRCSECVEAKNIKGKGQYPFDYFEAHPDRGFDIAPGRRNRFHIVDGHAYQIWSNALGCYDREQQQNIPYLYIAGDSQAWGYTPYR